MTAPPSAAAAATGRDRRSDRPRLIASPEAHATKPTTAATLSAPAHRHTTASPAASPNPMRASSDPCSTASGTYSSRWYGNGRRSTAGRITGAYTKIIDIVKPRKTACSTASYRGPSSAAPAPAHTSPASASHA
ncbi:hypothetical protein [Krasilnikovia sp. MM14-A1259]|uniref:hypothetical protein n=1 Tax=Krasilnikovia sp. MM14-A1259 TaxID=3373539 RepID=UPI00381F84F1